MFGISIEPSDATAFVVALTALLAALSTFVAQLKTLRRVDTVTTDVATLHDCINKGQTAAVERHVETMAAVDNAALLAHEARQAANEAAAAVSPVEATEKEVTT